MIRFGPYDPALTTLFIRVLDESTANVYNKVASVFEPFDSLNPDDYRYDLEDLSGLGVYTTIDFPAIPRGQYPIVVYREPDDQIGGQTVAWTGSGIVEVEPTVPVLSYSTPAEANEYFAGRLHSERWILMDLDQRQLALNDATRIINLFRYLGCKTVSTQLFEWPRTGFVDYPSDEVPIPILEAQYEIAYALLVDRIDINREVEGQRVTSRRYSGVATTYDTRQTSEWYLWGIPSYRAWLLLLPFLNRNAGTILLNRLT